MAMINSKGALELNWIGKEKSLYYEYDEDGIPKKPRWVDKNDIKVSEPRIMKLSGEYGDTSKLEDPLANILIRGDNLLALRTLAEMFKVRQEKDKVKGIYVDLPFNLGTAFENYDDNLEHSAWLTMIRDRLVQLKRLLREDGAIFVHLDYHEMAYLKIIMDEIFGRNNFVQLISIKTASANGVKTVNPGPISVTNYILFYTKNKEMFKFKKLYVPIPYNPNYKFVIDNISEPSDKWKIQSIEDVIFHNEKIKNKQEAQSKWGKHWKIVLNAMMADFAFENCEKVVDITHAQKPSKAASQAITMSKEKPEQVFKVDRKDKSPLYFLNGRQMVFYSNKIRNIDNEKMSTELLTDFWNDIVWGGIASEGGVTFRNGKKPEKLLKRIIEMVSEEGDIILDSFLGSGTTCAVAHKMNRRWIGIELGKQAETHCIPRLKAVVEGKDQSGVSKVLNWKGGGGFRYYTLGESLINDRDINWSLTYQEIAKAICLNLNYNEPQKINDGLYVGEFENNYAFCIVSKEPKILKEEFIYNLLHSYFDGDSEALGNSRVIIYTNNGIAIKDGYLPNNISTEKIPELILAKYNL